MKERDSNIELLRCVAMLLVLIIHSGFLALGVPTHDELVLNLPMVFFRYFNMSISIICVNVFILLSGWYGIKFKFKRLFEFIFQVLFFSILIYGCFILHDSNKYLNIDDASRILMLHPNDYWFVKSYLILYIFAPALNSFISNITKKEYRIFLICFYLMQTIYSWLVINGASDFGGGYSALSFMGLYLLSRYIRLYEVDLLNKKISSYLLIFVTIVLVFTGLATILTYYNIPIVGRIFTYTNPIVIIEALLFVIIFSKIKIKSKIINGIASSCFAVYLLHSHEMVLRPYYGKIIKHFYDTESSLFFLVYTLLFIISIFFIAILIDKIRMLLWKIIH